MNPEDTSSPSPQPEAPTPEPAPQTQHAFEPPKKKKKKVLVIVLAAVLALIITAGVLVFVQSQRATGAAATYTTSVREHATTIFSPDTTPKERAELIDKPVQLEEVFLGAELSGEYRLAKELKGRYDTLVSESAFTLKELFTFLDLSSDDSDFISSIGQTALTPAPGFSVTTDNADALAGSESFIKIVEEKSSKYATLAERAKEYTFPKELDTEKQAIVDGLTALSENEKQKATLQKEYNESLKAEGFNPETGQLTLQRISTINAAGVEQYGKLRQAVQTLVKNYIDGGVAERLVANSKTVNNNFESFIESIKE